MSSDSDAASEPQAPEPREVDPAYRDVLKLFTVLSRAQAALHARAREDVARNDLTLTEFGVLEALYHKGPLLLGAIREKILVSSGGITYLVDRLTERGLVERTQCPEDRRARYARLTPKALELMDRIFPEHARCIARVSGGLSPEETRTVTRFLKSLGKGAEEAPPCDTES